MSIYFTDSFGDNWASNCDWNNSAEIDYDSSDIVGKYPPKGVHQSVSLVSILRCREGFIIGSDSRRTVTYNNDIQYYDDEEKIFIIPETNVVAVATGANRMGPYNTPIKDIIMSCRGNSAIDLAADLSKKMIPFHGSLRVDFIECWKNNRDEIDGSITTFTKEFFNADTPDSFSVSAIVPEYGYIQLSGVKWALNFANLLRKFAGDYDEAIAYTKSFLLTMRSVSWFLNNHNNVIGGDIDIVTLTPDGAKRLPRA